MSALFISLEPFEEISSQDEPYELTLVVAYENPSHSDEVAAYFERIKAALNTCDGIELDEESGCFTFSHLTLDRVSRMRRWTEFDFNSFRGEAGPSELLDIGST